MSNYPVKRDLDCAYYRIEREGKYMNLCFSDLTESESGQVLAGKTVPYCISLINHLADRLHDMGDQLDLYGGDPDEDS